LRASRELWGDNPDALVEWASRDVRSPRDFDRRWNRRLTERALAEFEKLLRDHGVTLEEYEAAWHSRMLALADEMLPRGGTRKPSARSEDGGARANPWR
jgi:hypothetical protein